VRFSVLTLFPEMFTGPFSESIIKRALERKRIKIDLVQIRDYAENKHNRVDDSPYGGGPGMVMKPDVLDRALQAAVDDETAVDDESGKKAHVVYLTPQGKPFAQADVERLQEKDHLVLICGHYEGIDERFLQARVDEEISLGDFVLTGGEIPAMAVIDAVARTLPGVVDGAGSVEADSFHAGLLDHPHYTRPPAWEGREVPEVLLSGDHGAIADWRRRRELLRTLIRRPDLMGRARLEKREKRLIAALSRELEQAVGDDGSDPFQSEEGAPIPAPLSEGMTVKRSR